MVLRYYRLGPVSLAFSLLLIVNIIGAECLAVIRKPSVFLVLQVAEDLGAGRFIFDHV